MPPTKRSNFEVNVSDEIAASISSIVLGLMNARVYHQRVNMILAQKGFSFRSNGESIEVNIVPIGADKSNIIITSKSAWATTLFDWGINAQNIEQFEHLVKQLINLSRLLEKQKA